ncbi:MAG: 23S rRNA (uracil(1939)-C(5))-methyltransferase RlmD [Chromatiales bacterium]|nr:23S rRNA (uracil(1939)-C(5))-methyltransferase RlmD [Chromatiales bacterium]
MPRKPRIPQHSVTTQIESLTHDGRGVARVDGKTVFVDGALPGERVVFRYTAVHRRHDEGRVEEVIEASPDRVEPRCAHFDVCGGCAMQHLSSEAQVRFKQQAMLENLRRIGAVEPARVLEPLTGPVWGYRRKARLGVRYVPQKGRVLVGFREKRAHFLADIRRCEVLVPQVGERLEALSELVYGLTLREFIPQIEVAAGDDATALIFRHFEPPTEDDLTKLRTFGEAHGFHILLQGNPPEPVRPLWPETQALHYAHAEYDTRVNFHPLDFIQVNAEINRRMLPLALELLDVQPQHRVLDLFCGLGNFTLPLARRAEHVTGVEGEATMVERARENAHANGIANTDYFTADLAGELKHEPWLGRKYDRILLDPPRLGAREVIARLGKCGAERIVYVSCDPATLARDAGILVNELGYRLEAAGVMDMFPHTAHVESIALFVKR